MKKTENAVRKYVVTSHPLFQPCALSFQRQSKSFEPLSSCPEFLNLIIGQSDILSLGKGFLPALTADSYKIDPR